METLISLHECLLRPASDSTAYNSQTKEGKNHPDDDDDDDNLLNIKFDSDSGISDDEDASRETPLQTPTKTRVCRNSQEIYVQACKRMSIGPQQRLIQDLATPRIQLSHRHVGGRDVTAMATALVKNTTVKEIDIADNHLGAEGFAPLAEMLMENTQIKRLNVGGNSLGLAGSQLVARLLQTNKYIINLDISANQFDENCGEILGKVLKTNTTILELSLSHNELREFGAVRIGAAIAHNNTLKTLDLSWNNIRRVGGVIMCRGLGMNIMLTKVDLSWNGLGYDGSVALGALLKRNSTLKELNVSHNRIDWEGARQVAAGLKENNTLVVFEIGNNPLTTTGCMDLIDSISRVESGVQLLALDDVPVIAAFENTASVIQQMRQFEYRHGGIVNSHDILGQRLERRLEPMQVLINYMNERGLRPNELFRIMDKDVDSNMTVEEFMKRLKMEGFKLPDFEIRQIAEIILSGKLNHKNQLSNENITYKKMVHGVRYQIARERDIQITQRERQKRLERYHQKILGIQEPEEKPQEQLAETALPPINNGLLTARVPGIISMSTKLGASLKTKKKKRKSKKKAK